MEIYRHIEQFSAWSGTVGFVPTMGALHAGHVSLVERARAECDVVVVSIFVNPTQFNDPADLERYPRTEEADLRLLETAGTDIVFAPSVAEIYPRPDTRRFRFDGLDQPMEGACRPGHFNGVAQVVSRLFEIVRPTAAYFGEKDFQQLAIIRHMVAQRKFPVRIESCPIVREPDGLAMSSRNALLGAPQRSEAPAIYAALRQAQFARGNRSLDQAKAQAVAAIDSHPHLRTEYFDVVDPDTLRSVDAAAWNNPDTPLRGCVAVQAGNIRLIDNIAL